MRVFSIKVDKVDKVDKFYYKRFTKEKKTQQLKGVNNENNMNAVFSNNAKSPKWKSSSTLSTCDFTKPEKSALYLA